LGLKDALVRVGEVNQLVPPGFYLHPRNTVLNSHTNSENKNNYRRWGETRIGFEDGAITALPPNFGDKTSTYFEDLSGCIGTIGMGNRTNERSYKFRLEFRKKHERERGVGDRK
jgi:hypothetical protein